MSQPIAVIILCGLAIGMLAGAGSSSDHRPQKPLPTIPSDHEKVKRGWVTIGHEVRAFKPCDYPIDLWLMGTSPALEAILAAYREAIPKQRDYRPLMMELVGKRVPSPVHGFGADYEGAFLATHLVRVSPEASCGTTSDRGGSWDSVRKKIAFDISVLDEEGLLGLPGGKRKLAYEFCIPNVEEIMTEVRAIDRTVQFFSASPGRIGCADHEMPCIGSTHQQAFAAVLKRLAELPYVNRIEETFFD